jgi:hypothetical protein
MARAEQTKKQIKRLKMSHMRMIKENNKRQQICKSEIDESIEYALKLRDVKLSLECFDDFLL